MNDALNFADLLKTCTRRELAEMLATYANDLPTLRQMQERGLRDLEGEILLTTRIDVLLKMRVLVERELTRRVARPIIMIRNLKPQ